MKKRIAFIYPYFFPGYKGGGITQSLYNLSMFLSKNYLVRQICLDHDFREEKSYDLLVNGNLQQLNEQMEVHYIQDKSLLKNIYQSLKVFKPDFVYVPSIYDYKWLLMGFLYTRIHKKKLVIAPRGMLHEGGMEKNYLAKYIYLFVMKLFLSNKRTEWHATDDQEFLDINHWFGEKIIQRKGMKNWPFIQEAKDWIKKTKTLLRIYKAMDTSRPLPINIRRPQKKKDELKLVYYSLITSKKNLLLLLETLELIQIPVSLTVYGPAIETSYMDQCNRAVKKLGNHITVDFKGEVPYSEFAASAWQYNFFILVTKGENFGHVIFEALSLGLPVVISHFTPWQFEEGKEGFYTDLNTQSIKILLEKLYEMDQETYDKMSLSDTTFAMQYYEEATAKYDKEYSVLFSNAIG